MGAKNVALVFAHWGHLNHKDARALLYISLIALDADKPAVYWGGWQPIAEAMGYDLTDNPESARRQVTKALSSLAAAGAVVSAQNSTTNVRAEYALALDPRTTWQAIHVAGRDVEWVARERVGGGPKRSHTPAEPWDQNGPTGTGPKRSQAGDQNGPRRGTKTVPPMSTEEQRGTRGGTTLAPQASTSPAPDLDPEQERKRQLDALAARVLAQQRTHRPNLYDHGFASIPKEVP